MLSIPTLYLAALLVLGSGEKPTAPGQVPPPPDAKIAASRTAPETEGRLQELKIVNKKRQMIDFEVGRVGPSGLGSADVYVTTDEGASWDLANKDAKITLVRPEEGKPHAPMCGMVTVNLPKDGVIYGFYLVVKNKAGLGKRPPQSDDPPQVRLEADTTDPVAELYAPQTDSSRPNSLVLSWKADDRNIAQNPVSLEYAPSASGPWTFIGDSQLPNSGRYSWNVPDGVPPKVYLKLTVRDLAGNTAIAQTPEPVLIDLEPPEVRILGVHNAPAKEEE